MKTGLDGFMAVTYIIDIMQGIGGAFGIVMSIWGIAKGVFG